MDVNLEEGGVAGTTPDTGGNFSCIDGWFLAWLFSSWLIGAILYVRLLSDLRDDDAATGGGGKGFLPVAIAGGVFGAIGFAVLVCHALSFCWCCRSSGCMDRRRDGVLDVESKQPDPVEKDAEPAAGEYRDLVGGVGGKDGGRECTPPASDDFLLVVAAVIFIGVGFFLTVLICYPELSKYGDGGMATAGAAITFLIVGGGALGALIVRCYAVPPPPLVS